MPEPLVCEDSDLQRLLNTVHGQPGAEILYQDRVRRGGVFGFFAREVHRVAYQVNTDLVTGAVPDDLPGLEDLLASVEAAEAAEVAEVAEAAGQHSGRHAGAAAHPAVPPRHDFAEVLRTLTSAEPTADPATEAAPAATEAAPAATEAAPAGTEAVPAGTEQLGPRPVPAAPIQQPARSTNVTALGRPDARARLEMLLQLRQVGVPVSVNPRADTHSLYEALENILEDLPAPVVPPRGAGQVLAVVGESGPALQAAHHCAAMLRIPCDRIGVAGLPEHAGAGRDCRDHRSISGVQQALRLRNELSRADLPSVVVIATDATEAGSDDPWAAELVAALHPTAVWAVVDARWKTEDSRAQLDRLGRVDALVVHSAELSASPASVWDLDLPLGLLDGRAASTFAWAGLLLPLLRSGARHRATA